MGSLHIHNLFPRAARDRARRAPRKVLAAVATAALLGSALTLGLGGPAQAASAPETGLGLGIQKPGATHLAAGQYIVALRSDSAATYTGGVSGMPATKPAAGTQLKAQSAPVKKYTDYLATRQKQVAAAAGVTPQYSYTLSLNAFSATLTARQAAELAADKNVASLVPSEIVHPQAESGVQFLGLDGANGVWSKIGGIAKAGKGIVLGDIDTGIAPENPSFAGAALGTSQGSEPYRSGSSIVFAKADGGTFTGTCETGVQFTTSDCSTKIIGARYYVDGFGASRIGTPATGEYLSPRDGDGHGSHTGSTAVGDNGVDATVDDRDFGAISGVAPAAKIAAYKVCWEGPNTAVTTDDGCATADILAAIDQAVKDGVDVLNFSIGGGAAQTTVSLTDQAFLGAASAGIFVSAAAGNAGPGSSTLDNAAPWETTVAASTVPGYEGTVTLGNGQAYAGASVTIDQPVSGDLVRGDLVGIAGGVDPLLCGPNSLDPAKVAGKIVWCQRGTYDRVAKSAEVARAGGIGMVLVNKTPNSIDSDTHSVPTVHLNSEYYQPTFDYAGTAGATATLAEGNSTGVTVPTPQVADFSSRGPVEADGSDILKPDITAPGVAILAATANAAGGTPTYAFYSGTSMATPHIAGLAVLYLGVHPTASPAEIKSAMMTTAYDTVDADGAPVTDPFVQGAGHADPTKYFEPGLLYLNGTSDWLSYIVGAGYTLNDPTVKPIDPSDLNLASISIGALTAPETITRTVTSTQAGTFTAKPISIPGVTATVSPTSLSFAKAGESKSYTVTFTRTTAPLDTFATGSLSWVSGSTVVRSPIAVRPVTVVAPAEVTGAGISGSTDVTVTPGSTGSLPLVVSGLAAGTRLSDPEGSSADHTATGSAGDEFTWEVQVPAGLSFGRVDEVAVDKSADLDLTVYKLDGPGGDPVEVYSSATSSSDERVDLPNPEAGSYEIVVDVFAGSSAFDVTTFGVVSGSGDGSFTASPNPLPTTQGVPATYTVSWQDLAPNTEYLGVVGYGDSTAYTTVAVSSGAAPAPVATAPPTISGTPAVGEVLTADPGTWDVAGLTYAYQWQSNGTPIAGATSATYTVRRADVGTSLTVVVTASKTGIPSGTATSAAVVVKATSTLTETLSSPIALSSQRVKVTVKVTTDGPTPATGQVVVRANGVAYPVTLNVAAKGTVTLPKLRRGVYTVTASYAGSETVSAAKNVRRYLLVLF